MQQVSRERIRVPSLGNVKLLYHHITGTHPTALVVVCQCRAKPGDFFSLDNVGESGGNAVQQRRASSRDESEQSVLAS